MYLLWTRGSANLYEGKGTVECLKRSSLALNLVPSALSFSFEEISVLTTSLIDHYSILVIGLEVPCK